MYTAVIADTFKRWHELSGNVVKYSIGTDEHGLKIQQAAEALKTNPSDFCDSISTNFRELFQMANISNTCFVRTTSAKHREAVVELWKCLVERGHIYKGYHEGWYSVSDEAFVPLSQVVKKSINGIERYYAQDSGKELEWIKEENYKFRLSLFQDRLLTWLEANPKVIYPSNHQKDIINQLKSGISDISVSRLKSKVHWGIEVPNDPKHVIYVWLDALSSYLTAVEYPSSSQFAQRWPPSLQIIGKDILKFHAIYWPAFLMAAGLELPNQILSHGHWLVGGQKMSKSSGNGVDPVELMNSYGVDACRYFLVRDGHFSIDPEYSIETIKRRYDHDLGGHLGNILMRCSSPKINPSRVIPDDLEDGELNQLENNLIMKCKSIASDYY